jgi:hypothetical protein
MKKDINDFITIVKKKNGVSEITYNYLNESNIYKFLHELGFCKSKIGKKNIYYRRNGKNIIPSSFDEIDYTFWNFLQNTDFNNMPVDIDKINILEWFLKKNPIKKNELFDSCLSDNLSENEIHSFLLMTNSSYKHKYEINQLLSKFEEWSFLKTEDRYGSLCKNSMLYYKAIERGNYLIFSHYNFENKTNDGFDCWIATFSNKNQIGLNKPSNIQNICLSFQLNIDLPLIEAYL